MRTCKLGSWNFLLFLFEKQTWLPFKRFLPVILSVFPLFFGALRFLGVFLACTTTLDTLCGCTRLTLGTLASVRPPAKADRRAANMTYTTPTSPLRPGLATVAVEVWFRQL
jgi:hypothetical protein